MLMNLETFLLALSSLILLVSSRQAILSRVLSTLHLSATWGYRLDTISLLLVLYGILFLTLTAISWILHRNGKSVSSSVREFIQAVLSELRPTIHSYTHSVIDKKINAWLVLVLLLGASLRAFFLSQPMRGDEAYTFLNFVNKSFSYLFDYPAPNNHVFNTLLIKVSTLIFGASPATIRLPDFLAGIAIVTLTYQLARVLNPHKNSGLLAALFCAVFPYLILYSTNARGYSLVTLLTLLMAMVAFRNLTYPSLGKIIALAALAALGMWTIPSMLFGVAGIFLWSIVLQLLDGQPIRLITRYFALPFGFFCLIFTFILYTPVIFVSNGLAPIVANKFVESQSWPEFLSQFGPKILSTLSELTRDVPFSVIILGFILSVLGLFNSWKKRAWAVFFLLPCLLVGALLIVVAQHTVPFARLWIYILPFVFILIDYGIIFLVEHFSPSLYPYLFPVLVGSGIFYSVYLCSADIITRYPDTSAFPEAPIAVEYLKPVLSSNDIVRVTNTADWSVYFYFWYDGIPYDPDSKPAVPGKTFIIVKKSRYSIEDMTDQPVTKLLDVNNLALYQVVNK